MLLPWTVAVAHLLALGIGLGAVWTRARTLRAPLGPEAIRRVLAADTWWGVAALLWIATGLWRAFGGLEKPAAYYLAHPLFHAKIGLFLLIFLMELGPMTTFIKWRSQIKRGETPDTRVAPTYATVSTVQAIIVIVIVVCGVGLARGYML
jgi:putative membrane protein